MKKIVLVIIALVSLDVFAQLPGKALKQGMPAASKPKLVVAIVVDQFRYDYLFRFGNEYREGLKQLITRGAVFTNAHYEHFPTLTSVGHAAFLSGAFPSVNGIIGNMWYDRLGGRLVQSAFDSSVQQVGGTSKGGSSPRNLLVSTVGDELKIAGQGRNRVIGISLKDYSGILACGHMADAVYWFDAMAGDFVTSTYYVQELPAWAKEFNDGRPGDRYKGMDWQGTKLPADAGPGLYGRLASTPFGNELVEQMAEAAIKAEQLGKDADTDLLVVSFSANDYVGHSYGPDSAQVRDISVATDKVLGRLFRFIDVQVGMANVTVVFVADHGVAPMPEANAARKQPGGRIPFASIRTAVLKGLQEKFGEGNWISGTPEDAIYLDWELIKSRNLTTQEVSAEAARIIQAMPHVFRVYTREQLMNGTGADDLVSRRVRNSYSWARGGDLYVVLDPYFFFGAGRTTTHGTPFIYDSHVPVIFMGPGIKAAQFGEKIAINDIAPTLTHMLGVEAPSASEGRILSEIFQTK